MRTTKTAGREYRNLGGFMTRHQAALALFELLKKFPPGNLPPSYPRPLTVEAIEATIEHRHYLMGEESLKLHPWYPSGLRAGWQRMETDRERLWLRRLEAEKAEMARRQAELDKGKGEGQQ